MDQTPLPFVLDDGITYDKKVVKEVWKAVRSRQETSDCPTDSIWWWGWKTVIFWGNGLRISAKEKQSYYRRVKVMYQEKVWCDEEIMKEWISTDWANSNWLKFWRENSDCWCSSCVTNPCRQKAFKRHKISLVNLPPGCTSRVQVVDVLINKPFKDEVRSLFGDHLDKKFDQYVDGKINVRQRRVLRTKWVGDAWSKVGKMKDSIIRSFKKCGLSVALDGSENDEVNMRICRNIKCH